MFLSNCVSKNLSIGMRMHDISAPNTQSLEEQMNNKSDKKRQRYRIWNCAVRITNDHKPGEAVNTKK